MIPQIWTLGTWAIFCAIAAVVGSIGQWVWNATLARDHSEPIPPLIWLATSGVLFAAVAVLFIGHAAGFD